MRVLNGGSRWVRGESGDDLSWRWFLNDIIFADVSDVVTAAMDATSANPTGAIPELSWMILVMKLGA